MHTVLFAINFDINMCSVDYAHACGSETHGLFEFEYCTSVAQMDAMSLSYDVVDKREFGARSSIQVFQFSIKSSFL